jgi:uncharacterized protein YdeI (YjbR/CyaY-like superfamily)
MPKELIVAPKANGFAKTFADLSYSKRKEFARQVSEAKTEETKLRRIEKVLAALRN